MRPGAILLVPAMGLSSLFASCRFDGDAAPTAARAPAPAAPIATASVAPPQAAPAVAVPAPTASPSAAPVAVAEPSLPAELLEGADEPEPDAEPIARRGPEVDELASTAKETWVYSEPRWGSRRIGYLRAGAIVERAAEPAGHQNCPDGWYRVKPRGYVCIGVFATLDVHEPVVEASARRPSMDGLPYTYVMSRNPPPPLYARLPSEAEQAKAEPGLKSAQRALERARHEPGFVELPPADPLPSALLYGRPLPPLGNTWRNPDELLVGRARVRSGFALLSTFDHEGRRFGVTTELAVIPLDRTRIVKPSTFHGVKLDDAVTLPLAFVRSKHAVRFTDAGDGRLVRGEPLAHREGVPLTGRVRVLGGTRYLEAKDGSLLREEECVRLDPPQHMPAWATPGRRWIDVSILRQSLVAYEGTKPVYATLVSTGADGIGDPKKTRSTIQGAFLIHTKHVSVTMDGDEREDQFDFRDVPFVQYFTEGFALHAAYWHDEFGTPRSHGCVNLAPIDAAWLFGWTTPDVPAGWHAALTLKKGTLVHTHP
jgi:hypothetical protein